MKQNPDKLVDVDIEIIVPPKYKNNDTRTYNPLKDKITLVRNEIIKLDNSYEVDIVINKLLEEGYEIYYAHLYNNDSIGQANKFLIRDGKLYITLTSAIRHGEQGEEVRIPNYVVINNDNINFRQNPTYDYTFLDLVHGKLETISEKTIKQIEKMLDPGEFYTKKHKKLMKANKENIKPLVYKQFKRIYKRRNRN